MSFDATIAQLTFNKQQWQDEVTVIQESRGGWQNLIDQGTAREAELTALLAEVDSAVALLEGAFD